MPNEAENPRVPGVPDTGDESTAPTGADAQNVEPMEQTDGAPAEPAAEAVGEPGTAPEQDAGTAAARPRDVTLEAIYDYFHAIPDFTARAGKLIRQAFDEVIDGERTGRYAISQLERTEKTYIGTKIEILFRNAFELGRGVVIDCVINGHRFDIKFSLHKGGWMIPTENVGEVCLLIQGDEEAGTFSIGLIRANKDALRRKGNKDQKKGISADGQSRIKWLVQNQPLPESLLLSLDKKTRDRILSQASGQARVNELFRSVKRRIISREVICQVAQQKDALRRDRNAAVYLEREGIRVLCGRSLKDRAEAQKKLGISIGPNDHISYDV